MRKNKQKLGHHTMSGTIFVLSIFLHRRGSSKRTWASVRFASCIEPSCASSRAACKPCSFLTTFYRWFWMIRLSFSILLATCKLLFLILQNFNFWMSQWRVLGKEVNWSLQLTYLDIITQARPDHIPFIQHVIEIWNRQLNGQAIP